MRSVSLMPSETCNNCAIYAESQRKRSRETRSPKGLFLHQQIPGERTPRPTPSQWYWYHSCDSSRWFRLSRWSYCAAGAEGAEAVSSLSSLSLLLGLDSPVTAAAWSQLQGPVCVLFFFLATNFIRLSATKVRFQKSKIRVLEFIFGLYNGTEN